MTSQAIGFTLSLNAAGIPSLVPGNWVHESTSCTDFAAAHPTSTQPTFRGAAIPAIPTARQMQCQARIDQDLFGTCFTSRASVRVRTDFMRCGHTLGHYAVQRPHSLVALPEYLELRMSAMTSARFIAVGMLTCLVLGPVFALGLSDLTNQDASRGIKGALTEGAASAIAKLGVPGGFLNNPKVRIPLPPALDKLATGLRMIGRGKDADELVATMNQAAEQAVPEAKGLMVNAVKTMSVDDAKKILSGGDDSVTQFFKDKTGAPLAVRFLPIVKKATDRVGLAQRYNQFAAEGGKLGLIKGDAANIETYVTQKTLDGLYLMIGEEEHAIRQNPAAAGSAIVSKVFGALR